MPDRDDMERPALLRSRRTGLRTAILALALLVLFTAGTELALRLILGIGNPVLIAPDADCGYITRPQQNIYRFFVHTYINRFGMRSAEVSRTKPPGVVRVMFVGDSITYGTTHVDQHWIFTQVVLRGLPAIVHHPVEVLNASANAWAPDNEWSWVRSRGIFQSDFVVLVLNDGDLSQPRATMSQVGDDLPQNRPLTAIGELYTRFLAPRIFHIARHADAGDTVQSSEETARANLQDLSYFQARVAAQRGTMVLVYIPFRADIPTVAAPVGKVLAAWAGAHQVPMVNLTAAISPYTVGQICLYDHTHFNARGNRMIGDAILHAFSGLPLP